MSLVECYEMLHGDYNNALARLMSEQFVEKFMLKFLSDPTMSELETAVKSKDIEASFRGAHTLKGVAANLSFTELSKNASLLTEQLRPRTEEADQQLFKQVEDSYNLVIKIITEYKRTHAEEA